MLRTVPLAGLPAAGDAAPNVPAGRSLQVPDAGATPTAGTWTVERDLVVTCDLLLMPAARPEWWGAVGGDLWVDCLPTLEAAIAGGEANTLVWDRTPVRGAGPFGTNQATGVMA